MVVVYHGAKIVNYVTYRESMLLMINNATQCDSTLIHVNDVTECHSMLTNVNEMLTILLNVPQC